MCCQRLSIPSLTLRCTCHFGPDSMCFSVGGEGGEREDLSHDNGRFSPRPFFRPEKKKTKTKKKNKKKNKPPDSLPSSSPFRRTPTRRRSILCEPQRPRLEMINERHPSVADLILNDLTQDRPSHYLSALAQLVTDLWMLAALGESERPGGRHAQAWVAVRSRGEVGDLLLGHVRVGRMTRLSPSSSPSHAWEREVPTLSPSSPPSAHRPSTWRRGGGPFVGARDSTKVFSVWAPPTNFVKPQPANLNPKTKNFNPKP